MNIAARYATGYLGDIGVQPAPYPMDFSAWFEVYLSGRWHIFDARHNCRRIGRVLIARGRDAADVPITMSFGKSLLPNFSVITEEFDVRHSFSLDDFADIFLRRSSGFRSAANSEDYSSTPCESYDPT